MTLPVPHWAAGLRAEGWVNIHELIPEPPRLSAVDAFLGDPNATTLVLGKDSAPASAFEKLIARGVADPYRHDERLATNRNLSRMLATVGVDAPLDGSKALTCGVYYANAYWLLRGDGKYSGSLKNREQAWRESARVVEYMLNSLTHLQRIVAMGADAYDAIVRLFGAKGDWREDLVRQRTLRVDGLKVFPMAHLGFFGVGNRAPGATRVECWRAIEEDWRRAFL